MNTGGPTSIINMPLHVKKFFYGSWKYCFIAFFFLASSASIAQAQGKAKLRVFIIGNSFSQNATAYLPELLKEGGHELEIGRAELGGCSLQRHWETVAAYQADSTSATGNAYNGKSLKALLSVGKWDVVTIQQYSLLSADSATYQPYANKLYSYIKAIQPLAKVVVHQTWAYRTDAASFGMVGTKKTAESEAEMYQKLKINYDKLVIDLSAEIIPTGTAFWLMRASKSYLYVPEATKSAPIYPNLPVQKYSLHVGYKWSADKKLEFDSHHASASGKYLGSLVWYRFLFGADLGKVKFRPAEVDQGFANELKNAATRAVADKQLSKK